MKKKIKRNSISFVGESSNGVTGSCYYIIFGNTKILLECGLYQSSKNDYLDAYKINSEKYPFNPSEIDYVFINHCHIDHSGGLGRLYNKGFRGRIITTEITKVLLKPLLLNSCMILKDEARILSKKYKRDYTPLYCEEDVYGVLSLIDVYNEYDHIYQLNDNVSFQWFSNSHCVGAAQLQLILKDDLSSKKILYTSDIGALHTNNHYVKDTYIPQLYQDLVILESTYGSTNNTSRKTRNFDMKHLHTAIDTTLERGGSVVMPCFSFSRTQELLTAIYDIYGHDNGFQYEVIVDSKLSCEICDLYGEILKDDDLSKWEEVQRWKNVRFVSEKDDSTQCLADSKPKIIISSSGFCTNGRIINYLKKYLKDPKSMIIFSGFAGDNQSYLSYRIKNYRDQKYISINKERIANRADCITLSSFSSHANQADLIEYGSSLKTNKLILVHGSAESKKCLAAKLSKEICKKDNSYKVSISTKGMVVYL